MWASESEQFSKAQQYFDAIPAGHLLFAEQYAYARANALLEQRDYAQALIFFRKLDEELVSQELIDSILPTAYVRGQKAYREGDLDSAQQIFEAAGDYRRSEDYLQLIFCKTRDPSSWENESGIYEKRKQSIGFEDADENLLSSTKLSKQFLDGNWENYPYYFYLDIVADKAWGNLPRDPDLHTFAIEKDTYYLSGEPCFRFSVLDEDIIKVYCYEGGL